VAKSLRHFQLIDQLHQALFSASLSLVSLISTWSSSKKFWHHFSTLHLQVRGFYTSDDCLSTLGHGPSKHVDANRRLKTHLLDQTRRHTIPEIEDLQHNLENVCLVYWRLGTLTGLPELSNIHSIHHSYGRVCDLHRHFRLWHNRTRHPLRLDAASWSPRGRHSILDIHLTCDLWRGSTRHSARVWLAR
jgi:hypothetical protein